MILHLHLLLESMKQTKLERGRRGEAKSGLQDDVVLLEIGV